MTLGSQTLGKFFLADLEDVQTAPAKWLERRLAAHEMNRGAPLGPGFGERERSARKLERRQGDLPEELSIACAPPEPPRDHEVNHEMEIILEHEEDSLPETVERAHAFAFDLGKRRIDRS